MAPEVPQRPHDRDGNRGTRRGCSMRAARDAGLLVVGRRGIEHQVGVHTGPVTHAALHHVGCAVAVVPHD
ncbi:universal stress protein [Streptomyces sp. NPDC001480]|uniref:universal stress protein n=1 Tax=Streptomyces sp. NPDC001480 TaxID=3364577 RepID=UPI0036C49190